MTKRRVRKGKRFIQGHAQLVSGRVGTEEPRFLTVPTVAPEEQVPDILKEEKNLESEIHGVRHWARVSLKVVAKFLQIT